jgi:hypothetical protein
MESKASKKGGDENLALIKCFNNHKHGHYASQCSNKNKGKREQQQNYVAMLIETRVNEVVAKFKKDFSMVFCISTNTVPKNAWYVDNRASRHMTVA